MVNALSPRQPSPAPRRFGGARWLAAVLFPLALAMLLTGCMRMNISITLLEGDQASSTIEIAMQDDAITMLGMDPADFWGEAEAEMLADLPPNTSVESFAADGWSGFQIHVPPSALDTVGDLAGVGMDQTAVVRDGDYYVFTASGIGMQEEVAELEADYPFDTSVMDLSFDLACPGAVVESNGTITGNRVHWNLAEVSADASLTARCSAIAAAGTTTDEATAAAVATESWFSRWWPVVLISLLVLAGLALLAYYLRRQSHRDQEAVPANFDATGEWVQPEREYVAPVMPGESGIIDGQTTDAFGAPEQWKIDDLGGENGNLQ